MAKKVLFVIAYEGYQPVEYDVPKKILEEHGYEVITASNKPGMATAKDGTTTQVDLTLDKVNVHDYDAVIFIGGPGAMKNLDNDLSYEKIQNAVMGSILIGGICHATRILAKAGALVTKNATGWDGDGKLKEIYDEHGAIYDEAPVITDGLIITAVGPDEADEFAQAIMKVV